MATTSGVFVVGVTYPKVLGHSLEIGPKWKVTVLSNDETDHGGGSQKFAWSWGNALRRVQESSFAQTSTYTNGNGRIILS